MKIKLIGDGAVGKTSLREAFIGRAFKANYLATIGADFTIKMLKVDNKQEVKVQVWDLAGQQHFSQIRNVFYKGTLGFIFVFDVTRSGSLENFSNWLEEIKKVLDLNTVTFVVSGNKVDLRSEDVSHIKTETASNIINDIKNTYGLKAVDYIETSAKENTNVQLLFSTLVSNVLKNNP